MSPLHDLVILGGLPLELSRDRKRSKRLKSPLLRRVSQGPIGRRTDHRIFLPGQVARRRLQRPVHVKCALQCA